MNKRPLIVSEVMPYSLAEEIGIQKGDALLSINNQEIEDEFDYLYYLFSINLIIEIQKHNGDIWEIEIEKDEYEDLGIEFERASLDRMKSCCNKCIFCFIDQLPTGMRESLYFKDDDSRLSFLMGNYVTLTNMKDHDLDKIIRYKMSPINISVHTTNPDLRVLMLKNKNAHDIMKKIKKLIISGIKVNCQIVLCRGFNDGKELDRSLCDMSSLYPGLQSISVVPVGLTKYRDELTGLLPYDKDSSISVITQVESWQKTFIKEYHSNIVYLADEFYIMADIDIPDYNHYEDFPQLENGVGLIAMLKNHFYKYLNKTKRKNTKDKIISIATGVSSYEIVKELAQALENKYNNIKINVFKINNDFFGPNVTVTGLLTAQDIIKQLKDKKLGQELLICKSMLKSDEDKFLDDMTLKCFEKTIGVKVRAVENDGKQFVKACLV